MEKPTIKEVIIVEGKNDTNHLKKFFNVDTIETNGLGISKNIIEYIKVLNDIRGVIVMCDPDTPGEKIRKKINDSVPGLKNVFLNKEDARTKKKVGVEHANYETIYNALKNCITYRDELTSLLYQDFVEAGLVGRHDSSFKRDALSCKYHLGHCNAKTLYKRLNMIGIKKEDLI